MNKIDQRTIHKICSSQVIVDLANALKELVENAVDADSRSISIQFKALGLEEVKVIDDGSGITEEHFSSLCLAHHTSKLTQFNDLESVSTYGFRGEALSALCSMSKLSIQTSSLPPNGYHLEFNAQGVLTAQTSVARQRGTTVTLSNIFHSTPVRMNEFKNNSRREIKRAMDRILPFALLLPVAFTVINFNAKGHRNVMVKTTGKTLLENITELFDAKQAKSLIQIELEGKFSGYISRPTQESGRIQCDRQYIYVNQRPCHLPKITRCINEIYKELVPKFPFIVLNLRLPLDSYDVNVTPDKRTLFLHNENELIESIKEYFTELFEPFRGYTISSTTSFSSSTRTKSQCSSSQGDTVSEEIPAVVKSYVRSDMVALPIHTETTENIVQQTLSFKPIQIEKDNFFHKPSQSILPSTSTTLRIEKLACSQQHKASLQRKIIIDTASIKIKPPPKKGDSTQDRIFKSSIDQKEEQEEEFNAHITKQHFSQMKIIGQFNKGFIITLLDEDLFIIDQHASDEKFNYERYIRESGVSSQRLYRFFIGFKNLSSREQLLDWTPQMLMTLRECIDVVKTYGWHIIERDDALYLQSVPQLKNVTFTAEDLEEWVYHKLKGQTIPFNKTTKAARFYASKACRTSIMIGTVLEMSKMKQIVSNLATLNQPWNCPHGRPTMRHLHHML